MRIVVTGAQGFIGRQVLAALHDSGDDVIAISRRPPKADAKALWIAANLLDQREAVRAMREARADRLIHLAWTVDHGKFWTDPANMDWTAASLMLVRAACEAGIRHATMAGTCFEYDWPPNGDCHEHQTPTAPHTFYDIAKDACRRLLAAYARQSGFGFAWARLFHIYGEAEHPARLVASVARALVAGETARCSRGLALRDWMDVRDAGAAIAAVCLAGLEGPVNIASGESATVANLAQRLGDIAGHPDLVAIGALPDRPEPPRITADVSRLTGIGYTSRYTLDRGLADALAYWRTQQVTA